MEIQTTQVSQNYQNNVTSESTTKVDKVFENMINEDGSLKISLNETELKKLSYEEAKELREKLEENGYCRKGFFELNRTLNKSIYTIHGECNESATAADRKNFIKQAER